MKRSERIVIAGAGVSGLYTAWRLVVTGHDPACIRVLEQSGRTGGRLWSVKMAPDSTLPAELGGMFFNDQQPLVFNLCTRALALEHESITPQPDFAWLRSVRFRVPEFADPDVLPYALADDEKGLTYYELLDLATGRIAPGLDKLWPSNSSGTRAATIEYLRTLDFDGRPLYQWGFWNLLARVISNEAWQALRGIVSSYTLFENWNGYDAMISLVVEQSGAWFRLTDGYEQLPTTLADRLRAAGVTIALEHRLERVDRTGSGFDLRIAAGTGVETASADRLVLAMPLRAIRDLVDASPDLQNTRLDAGLGSVKGVDACKIFLTFDRPWWLTVPDGPGLIKHDTYGVSHTDLPLRQCYYLGEDRATGQGLMLASYADGDAVSFWGALMDDCGRSGRLRLDLSDRAREEVRRQLSEMHGVDVPAPVAGLFVDWTVAPFGGGWHNWQPGWKSWEMVDAMRHPIPDCALFVCGESWSAAQGWTEGALETAESMLQHEFGLQSPDWLDDSPEPLAAYRAAPGPSSST